MLPALARSGFKPVPHDAFRLMALCARGECDAVIDARIAETAGKVTVWDGVPAQAEVHGVAPLLDYHLRRAGVAVPHAVRRELSALSIRHRLASETRTRVLHDILACYRAAGIRVLMLKGAALAYLLYPTPALRPMRDVDLLVGEADLARAQQLLATLGFDAPGPSGGSGPAHRHLPSATLARDGFTITVEVHHNLFEPGAAPILMGMGDLTGAPLEVPLGFDDIAGKTLGFDDTIWYLCQHLVESMNVFSSPGLIWIADVVSFAERFAAEIDWGHVQRRYPIVVSTLSLLHFLTPLSEALRKRAHITIGREPDGIWDEFRKLPRTAPEEQMRYGMRRTISDGLFPSEWWLRLYHGVGSASPLKWHHRARHVGYVARRMMHVLARRRRALI